MRSVRRSSKLVSFLPKRTQDDRGFTLIEIMVVIFIIALLAALVVPKIIGRTEEAKRVSAKAQIREIENALNLYHLDNGTYPTTEQTLDALIKKPTTPPVPNNYKDGGYISKIPKDPWGHPYIYLSPGNHGEFDIISYGADGVRGGTGNNADIDSWAMDK
ncbi:type II secretion system major pseudopilin GspG [Leptospirillum ferriphilum]|uniref:Type II secretion system core protein G n=2 Tax=Leptospirillum TaxID=179 RepID=A0A094WBV7_9BACT|nr:type II secretion system major pseudopilin GspG [Leptospirillum sp. Group II 'CF-1']EAY57292.1 MAG: General secretion pathway protein G [Leptospirillum rubarum]EDZ38642.1 MAG: General secretion pathway protein G [Leptospirillum sp. Group II '5-way CG']EIJ77381.1 MAG: General secretion pathway protein G [Leptospirillum sp. Group II 'C75']KGA93147.1 General secretion pathway protein G [Leptospirillum ferriphilum]AKS23823.1 general secretion pathway protein GspG [Leptospirillum sp. Group II 'C